MIEKYAVVNPMNGQHTLVDTIEQAEALKATLATELYNAHTHNSGIVKVGLHEDGSLSWNIQTGSGTVSGSSLNLTPSDA